MAKALKVDWGVVIGLKTAGATYNEIAGKLGVKATTLRTYIHRHIPKNTGIRATPNATDDTTRKNTVKTLQENALLDATGYKLQAERIAKKHLDYLENQQVTGEKSLVQRSVALSNTNTVAKTLYGLDNPQTVVNVGMVHLDSEIAPIDV